MTYSIDFRKKVLEIKAKEGLTCQEISVRFNIGIMSVVRWGKKLEPQKKRSKPSTKIDMEMLKQDVKDHPDSYQYERAKRLKVSSNTVLYALRRLGITYKKNAESPQGGSRKTLCFLPED
jgi:transposase